MPGPRPEPAGQPQRALPARDARGQPGSRAASPRRERLRGPAAAPGGRAGGARRGGPGRARAGPRTGGCPGRSDGHPRGRLLAPSRPLGGCLPGRATALRRAGGGPLCCPGRPPAAAGARGPADLPPPARSLPPCSPGSRREWGRRSCAGPPLPPPGGAGPGRTLRGGGADVACLPLARPPAARYRGWRRATPPPPAPRAITPPPCLSRTGAPRIGCAGPPRLSPRGRLPARPRSSGSARANPRRRPRRGALLALPIPRAPTENACEERGVSAGLRPDSTQVRVQPGRDRPTRLHGSQLHRPIAGGRRASPRSGHRA